MFINITIAIVMAIAIALVCSTIILESCVHGQVAAAAVTNDNGDAQQKNFSDPNMTTLEHDNDTSTSPSSQ